MTATSASVQRKGQWFRLDARQFSRQLENNTRRAHSIHAAGTEALPTGTSGEDVTVEGRRLEEDDTQSSQTVACHCTSFIPILTLHSEGMMLSSMPLHCLCHPTSIKNFSLPTSFLPTLLGVHPAGLGSLSSQYPGVGRAVRHCAGMWSGCWVSPSQSHPPSASRLQVSKPCCYCFNILQSLSFAPVNP